MTTRRLAPIGLGLACVVPVLAGVYRGSELFAASDWHLAFAPEHVDGLPLFVHVVSSAVFYVLGALQVLPGFRRRHPRWHRVAGGVAILSGLLGAATGTWMTAAHREISGPLLMTGRLMAGSAWGLFIVVGIVALARRDFARHGAWMVRAFAVAMPAGTLIFLFTPFWIALGEVPQQLDEALQVFAWVLHLSIAEVLIRRRRPSHPLPDRNHGEVVVAPGGAHGARR